MAFLTREGNREWTEEGIQELIRLDAASSSITYIAEKLGMTKGQVSGKISRMKLRETRPKRTMANGACNTKKVDSLYTDAVIAKIRELHAQGKWAADIAKATGFSRNQITGKLTRMGLTFEAKTKGPPPKAKSSNPRTVTRQFIAARPIPVAVPVDAAPVVYASGGPSLPGRGCMYPMWGNADDYRSPLYGVFCDAPKMEGKSAYCERHFRVCVSRVIPQTAGLPPPSQLALRF